MENQIFTCQELCDPSTGVCFRKADIERMITDSSEPQNDYPLQEKERVVTQSNRLKDSDCRIMNLATAALAARREMGPDTPTSIDF